MAEQTKKRAFKSKFKSSRVRGLDVIGQLGVEAGNEGIVFVL